MLTSWRVLSGSGQSSPQARGGAHSFNPKAFDALVFLVQNAGRLLRRDELIRALWPDSFVEEGNLSVHVFQIRKALGTAADEKAYIQTVAKKDCRFVAEVTVLDDLAESVKAEALRVPGGSGPMSDTGVIRSG